MATQWKGHCTQCNRAISYADALAARDASLGRPRMTLCPLCERAEHRGLKPVALPEVEISGQLAADAAPLGRLPLRPATHMREVKPPEDLRKKFGVNDDEIAALYSELLREDTPVVIGVAPTGSGKSTFLVHRLLAPNGHPADTFTRGRQIVVTQPRRQATTRTTQFVSASLHGADFGIGHEIGYRVSKDHGCDWRNRLTYVTDGTLINWLVRGELDRISLIIIDEAHERSLNIDVILALLTRCLPQFPHLKMIIVSATIDHEKFIRHFDARLPGKLRCGLVNCTGDKPVGLSVHWRLPEVGPLPYQPGINTDLGKSVSDQLADAIIRLVLAMDAPSDELAHDRVQPGDVLGFLHGAQPILQCVEKIQNYLKTRHPQLHANTDVYPLFAAVERSIQDKATEDKPDPNRRRIVIASNAAETSLTIKDLVHVVESGFIKQTLWDPVLEQAPLLPVVHSQAGCRQRWGRVGRSIQGWAWCLYAKSQFEQIFPGATTPEIQRSSVDGVVLSAKRGGADGIDAATFPWLDAPSADEIGRTLKRLRRQGAIDDDGDLTEAGILAAISGGEDALYARFVADADRFGFGIEVATLVALLKLGLKDLLPIDRNWDDPTRRSVREAQSRLRATCGDDLELALRIYGDWTRSREAKEESGVWPMRHGIDVTVLQEAEAERKEMIRQLGAKKKGMEDRHPDFPGLDRLRAIAARAFPEQVYIRSGSTVGDGGREVARYLPFRPEEPEPTPLEIGFASNCRGDPPDAILALGPKDTMPSKGDRERFLVAPFVVRLDLETARTVADLNDFQMAAFLRRAHPRPAQRSEEDRRLRKHERLRAAYPAGTLVDVRVLSVSPDGADVEVVDRVGWGGGSVPRVGSSEERRERRDYERENQADFDPLLRRGKARNRQQSVPDIEIDLITEEMEEMDPRSSPFASLDVHEPASGRLRCFGAVGAVAVGQRLTAEVTRHTELTGHAGLILVAPPIGERYKVFRNRFRVGNDVETEVLGPAPASSRVRGLQVRELFTGLELVVPTEELVLAREDILLASAAPGSHISLRIDALGAGVDDVRLSGLHYMESDLVRLHASAGGAKAVGTIRSLDHDERRIYVWVTVPGEGPFPVPVKVIMARDRFEISGELKLPYKPGDLVHLELKAPESSSSQSAVRISSNKENAAIAGAGITVVDGQLRCEGRMEFAVREQVLRACRSSELVDAVRELWRASNSLRADWFISDLERRFPLGSTTAGRVEFVSHEIGVMLPGGIKGTIRRTEVSWFTPSPPLKEMFESGQDIRAVVLGVELSKQRVELSVRQLTADPWVAGGIEKLYPRTGTFTAMVRKGAIQQMAWVVLEPGLEGVVHVTRMRAALSSGARIEDVRNVLKAGQYVYVQVHAYDATRRQIELTITGRAPSPARTPGRPVVAPPVAAVALAAPNGWLEGPWPWSEGEDAIRKEKPRPAAPSAPKPPARIALENRALPSGWRLRR